MPQNQGASISDWDLSQYPGIGGGALPPISLSADLVALINGGVLPPGDSVARISDIIAYLNSVTKGLPADTLGRKLLSEAETRAITVVNPTLLNGFTGGVTLKVSALGIHIVGNIVAPAGAAIGLLVCSLPFPVEFELVKLNNGVGGVKNDQYYTNDMGLYHLSSTPGNSFLACHTTRI